MAGHSIRKSERSYPFPVFITDAEKEGGLKRLKRTSFGTYALGACPRIRMCRVPSAAWADARRRDAGDVGASPGSANEADARARHFLILGHAPGKRSLS